MNKLTICAGVALAAAVMATTAAANRPGLDATWTENGQVVATWSQDLAPTPVASIAGYETQVPVFNFVLTSSVETSVYYFASTPYGGGLQDSFGGISDTGPQIYSGTEGSPTFAADTYTLGNGSLTLTTSGNQLAAALTENGQLIATWDQATSPTPDASIAGYYTQVPVSNWVLESAVESSVVYFNASSPSTGGLQDGSNFLNDTGVQVYGANEANPTFTAGTYALGNGSLTLTNAAIPEPATWAMMLVGFALLGSAARARRTLAA